MLLLVLVGLLEHDLKGPQTQGDQASCPLTDKAAKRHFLSPLCRWLLNRQIARLRFQLMVAIKDVIACNLRKASEGREVIACLCGEMPSCHAVTRPSCGK